MFQSDGLVLKKQSFLYVPSSVFSRAVVNSWAI